MKNSASAGVVLTLRLPKKSRDSLGLLAEATGHTKSFLAAKAIDDYLEKQAWQIQAIQKALKKANSKTAKYACHEDVSKWLLSWGSKSERKPPKCK